MRPRILVVDGDSAARNQIRQLAEPLGIHVAEATAFKGLGVAVKSAQASLVIVELDTDPAAAFRAVDALKADPDTSDVQVLAVASHLDSSRTAGATEHGFEDFVSKPVRKEELVPILRFHLDLPHGLNDAHPM